MRGILAAVTAALVMSSAPFALAQQQPASGTAQSASGTEQPGALKLNQTAGFGAGKVLTFTYTQNFDCVDQPTHDLNFNGVEARNNPAEMQIPICQAGSNVSINPPGMKGDARKTTDPLYVMVPMFSVDNDQNPDDAIRCDTGGTVPDTLCGPQLGQALIKFFGALPEGFKETPLVYTQCPRPTGPGTCTMHATRIDLAPVLADLGYIANPPTANVFVPSPNHSHLLASSDINKNAEWWQVLPVLVLNPNDWPSQDGTTGITTVGALKAAEKTGDAIEAPSNFFLYFGSKVAKQGMNMDMGK
jgi:hypothetical protein